MHDALRVACSVLESEGLAYGQGTECAFEDAAWLLLWSLDLPRDRLDDFRECQLSRAELRRLARLLRTRVESRTPVAYLTSEAWLHGLCFRADPRALIPRSLLVEALVSCSEQGLVHSPMRILDLCTGSASILVHAGLRFPQASLFGSDLSAPALSLAAENLNAHGISGRCDLRCGPGLSPWAGNRFDLLLCNPPYVTDAAMESLPPEFLAEPRTALSGGCDGMSLIRPWLAEVAHFLDPDGAMLLEIGHGAGNFEDAFPGLDPVWIPVAAGPRMVALLKQPQLLAYFPAEQPFQGSEQLHTS